MSGTRPSRAFSFLPSPARRMRSRMPMRVDSLPAVRRWRAGDRGEFAPGATPAAEQRHRRRVTQRCAAGGDDVVDDQHREPLTRPTGTKRRADQPFGTGLAGLWCAVRPVQQAPARDAELPGDRAGDHLRLVVPAPAHPPAAGRRPGDDIDVAADARRRTIWRGEHTSSGAAVAELQGDDQLAGDAVEREMRRPMPCGRAQLIDRRQREPAPMTQRRTGRAACSTTVGGTASRRRKTAAWCNQYQEGVTRPSVGSGRAATHCSRIGPFSD